MKNAWMVRSDGGAAIDLFEEGWVGMGSGFPMSMEGMSQDEIRTQFEKHNPNDSKGRISGAVGMLERFVNVIQEGDGVVTYDPGTRVYWVGHFVGGYYMTKDDYLGNRRRVEWEPQAVSRDDLSVGARNSLGSVLTLFSVSQEIWEELNAVIRGDVPNPEVVPEVIKVELEQDKRNVIEDARERLKCRNRGQQKQGSGKQQKQGSGKNFDNFEDGATSIGNRRRRGRPLQLANRLANAR